MVQPRRPGLTGPFAGWPNEDARTTVAEDLSLMRSVQGGLSSRGYRPGPLVIDPDMGLNSEHTVAAIKSWYMEAMDCD